MAEAQAGPEGERKRRAVPETVMKQMQGCSGEKRRKGPGFQLQRGAQGWCGGLQYSGGTRAGDSAGLPATALTQDRAG